MALDLMECLLRGKETDNKQLNNTSRDIQELLGRTNGCEKKLMFQEQKELGVIGKWERRKNGQKANGVGGDETEVADRPDDARRF